MADEAYDAVMPAKANADKTDEADKANKADKLTSRRGLAHDVDDAEVAKANDAEETKATDADEADEADAIVLFFIIANTVIVIPRSLLDEGIVIILYSLTKYSAVFAKRKGYFGIMISNNQRGCFLEIWNDYQRNKINATINLDV
jgi:hypothetical protein